MLDVQQKKKKKKTCANMSAADRHTGGGSRSREAHRGAVEKASFMQDGVGHGLGLGEVRKGQKSPQWRHATAYARGTETVRRTDGSEKELSAS